jgi:hypothetical protein
MTQEIKPTYVTYEQAKLLKEKGFNEECIMFYTQPNSKMFGIDEHGRYYSIKNKPKTLWIVGNVATLNIKNVLLAPEQHQVVEWLRVNHGIWVYPLPIDDDMKLWQCRVIKGEPFTNVKNTLKIITCGEISYRSLHSPQEAYSAAFDYILNNLI